MLSLDHKRHLVEKPQSAEAGSGHILCILRIGHRETRLSLHTLGLSRGWPIR